MRIKFYGDEEIVKEAERCLEVIIGDYKPHQQYAASILMHMLLKRDYNKFVVYLKEATGYKVNNRGSSQVAKWKKEVKKIGKCEICGSTKKLVAHHIIPWEYSIKGRTDVSNGQCLCEKCHKMIHNDVQWMKYMKKRMKEHGKSRKTT